MSQKKKLQKIYDYIMARKNSYFSSECFNRLKRRRDKLRDSIDLRFHTGRLRNEIKNQWMSKIAFPLVRERYMLRRAILRHNFRARPLYNLAAIGATTPENAMNMQDVLNLNLKHTQFREQCFSPVTDSVAAYGNAIAYSMFRETENISKRTISHPILGVIRTQVESTRKNIYNYDIDILNFFTNENIRHPWNSDYHGHVERKTLANVIRDYNMNPDAYIEKTMKRVIDEAKQSSIKDPSYREAMSQDWEGRFVDKIVYWGRLNIKGNEDDLTIYYVEIIGEDVVRVQENPYDDNIIPYSIFRTEPRPEFWWSNIDSELVIPHENFMNLSLNMTADNVLRNMERYIFYQAGDIDPADINERHKNGGMIPLQLRGKLPNQVLYEFQGRDTNTGALDYITREVKESKQQLSPKPDFLRAGNKGGLSNSTATAANIMQSMGDVLESDPLEQFSFGLRNLGKVNVTLLQQYLGDHFNIRPEPRQPYRTVDKAQILGDFEYEIESSLTKNMASEAFRLQNAITGLLNFINSGYQGFQNIDLTPVMRQFIKKLDLPGEVDDIIRPMQQQSPVQLPMQAPALPPAQEAPALPAQGAQI